MRTIKFKAKGIKKGEWIVGDLLHTMNRICIHPECSFTPIRDKIAISCM